MRPTDRGQHLVFALLIVTGLHRPSLQVAPQVPAQGDHHGTRIKLHAATREMKHARRDDAGAVDHDADDPAARLGKPAVDRPRRRGRRRIETEQAKVAGQTVDDLGIEWRHRAVVDDDNLVVVGGDVPLVGRRKGIERARRFSCHVMHDNDDRKSGSMAPRKPHSSHQCSVQGWSFGNTAKLRQVAIIRGRPVRRAKRP